MTTANEAVERVEPGALEASPGHTEPVALATASDPPEHAAGHDAGTLTPDSDAEAEFWAGGALHDAQILLHDEQPGLDPNAEPAIGEDARTKERRPGSQRRRREARRRVPRPGTVAGAALLLMLAAGLGVVTARMRPAGPSAAAPAAPRVAPEPSPAPAAEPARPAAPEPGPALAAEAARPAVPERSPALAAEPARPVVPQPGPALGAEAVPQVPVLRATPSPAVSETMSEEARAARGPSGAGSATLIVARARPSTARRALTTPPTREPAKDAPVQRRTERPTEPQPQPTAAVARPSAPAPTPAAGAETDELKRPRWLPQAEGGAMKRPRWLRPPGPAAR